MRFTALPALLVLVCGGCAPHSTVAPTVAPREPASATQPAPAPPRIEPPAAAPARVARARAIVTGVLVRRSDGIEVCPGSYAGPCAGIRVEGKVDEAWIATGRSGTVYRLRGVYDGTTLVLDAPAEATAIGAEPDFRNKCPELQAPKKGVNPSERLSTFIEAFVKEHVDRVAGWWWDRERQAIVIWVTGDPSALRASVAQRAPKERICIQGEARFPDVELERIQAKADRILVERGVARISFGRDVLTNRIVFEVEAIDAPTRAELTREAGDAVEVVPFIELLEHTLAQMPVPPPRGDIALVTAKARSSGGMTALGHFELHYDAEKRCVYFGTAEERILPVWPFGYWASSSPARVFDYDGNLVAQEGEARDYGGGHVDIAHVRSDNDCGAKHAWIGRPEPLEHGKRRP